MIDDQKTFKIRQGYCHVLPDKLVFTKDGNVEQMLQNKPQQHDAKMLKVIFGVLIIGLLYFTYLKYQREEVSKGTFISAVIMIPAFYFYLLLGLRYTLIPYIERDKIIKMTFRKGIPGLLYSRIIIRYKLVNGKTQQATLLPFYYEKDRTYFDNAVKILTEEGLLTNKQG